MNFSGLGLACWPSGDDGTQATVRALFSYNLLVALYWAIYEFSEVSSATCYCRRSLFMACWRS